MDNIELKNIWQQKTNPENLDQIYEKIKQLNRKNRQQFLLLNLIVLTSIIFVLIIYYTYKPQLITTKIGVFLTVLAMLFYAFVYHKNYFLWTKKMDKSVSNQDFLTNLKLMQQKQYFLQTRLLSIYFLMLSTGIFLYLYEYTSKMQPLWSILSYIFLIFWITFNYFYLKPKSTTKQQTKIQSIIEDFEKN